MFMKFMEKWIYDLTQTRLYFVSMSLETEMPQQILEEVFHTEFHKNLPNGWGHDIDYPRETDWKDQSPNNSLLPFCKDRIIIIWKYVLEDDKYNVAVSNVYI
jgi:hypothetical protein